MTQLIGNSLLTLLLFLVPAVATAQREKPEPSATTVMTPDQIIQRHIAAHGGEPALRAGLTFRFTVARNWEGEITMKTVYQTQPNMTRTDGHTAKGSLSFGYDGKLVWRKRGVGPAWVASPEEAQQIKAHMEFDGWELVAGPLFTPLRLPKAVKDAIVLVFENGRFNSSLSDLKNVEDGITRRGEHNEKQILSFLLGRASGVHDTGHCYDHIGLWYG